MKLVFWQNIISPHFSYFLNELAKTHEVILIIEQQTDFERSNLGWQIPVLNNIAIFSIDSITIDITNEEYEHFFSGFNSYPKITTYFKRIIKLKKVNVIAEAPIQLGLSKYIKYIKYFYLRLIYKNSINKIYAMGNLGVNWYKKIGFPTSNIHNFQYTINNNIKYKRQIFDPINIHFTFIGQLVDRKGVVTLLNTFSKIENKNWKLHIIGNGNLLPVINALIKKNNLQKNVLLLGVLANNEAIKYMANTTDYLLLPSKFDGWGAVINEALSQGVKVVTNTNCGASKMINDNKFGYVYKEEKNSHLKQILEKIIKDKLSYSTEISDAIAAEYTVLHQENVVKNFIKTL